MVPGKAAGHKAALVVFPPLSLRSPFRLHMMTNIISHHASILLLFVIPHSPSSSGGTLSLSLSLCCTRATSDLYLLLLSVMLVYCKKLPLCLGLG